VTKRRNDILEDFKRRRGRPGGEISRGKGYLVTLSDDEFERLGRLSRITGKTKAAIFREAYDLYEKTEMAKRPIFTRSADDYVPDFDEYEDEHDDWGDEIYED
jgi:hypothetical protein